MSELSLAKFEQYDTEKFKVQYLENAPHNVVYFQGPLAPEQRIPHPDIAGLYYSPTIVILCDGTFRVENTVDDKVIDAIPGMLSVWRTPGRYKFLSTSGMNTCICLTPKENKIHFRDTLYFDSQKPSKSNFNDGWLIGNVDCNLSNQTYKKFELIKVNGSYDVEVEINGWFLHVWL